VTLTCVRPSLWRRTWSANAWKWESSVLRRALGALHRLADDRRRQAGGAPRQIGARDQRLRVADRRGARPLADIAVVEDR